VLEIVSQLEIVVSTSIIRDLVIECLPSVLKYRELECAYIAI